MEILSKIMSTRLANLPACAVEACKHAGSLLKKLTGTAFVPQRLPSELARCIQRWVALDTCNFGGYNPARLRSLAMTVKVEREDPKDPVSNVWFTALSDGKAELGAHVLANARRDDASLSVFWCGDTSPSRFRNAVHRTEQFFLKNGGYVQGKLFAYGPSKEEVGPIMRKAGATVWSSDELHGVHPEVLSSDPGLGEYLSEFNPLARFSAYRAEFEGTAGQVILWANVVDDDPGELEEGGDNIGICTSPTLFDGPARTLIVDTIEETRQGASPTTRILSREVVGGLLNEIAEKVHQTVDHQPQPES